MIEIHSPLLFEDSAQMIEIHSLLQTKDKYSQTNQGMSITVLLLRTRKSGNSQTYRGVWFYRMWAGLLV
jgi:hypothetical protein